jgi:hypothetical protein
MFKDISNYPIATMNSWTSEFKSKLIDYLLRRISDLLNMHQDPYAQYTAIINSLGTEKSYMVNELVNKSGYYFHVLP